MTCVCPRQRSSALQSLPIDKKEKGEGGRGIPENGGIFLMAYRRTTSKVYNSDFVGGAVDCFLNLLFVSNNNIGSRSNEISESLSFHQSINQSINQSIHPSIHPSQW